MTIAVVADHIIETENEYSARATDRARHRQERLPRAGQGGCADPGHEARELPHVPRRPGARARRPLPPHPRPRRDRRRRARSSTQQRAWLDDFWDRSDVRIAGHDDLQQATRWCLFQLAQAAARADGQGVPAKGVTGLGLQRPLLLGHRDLRPAVPHVHDAALGAQRAAHAVPHAPGRPPARASAERGGRALPVADDQRGRGIRLLRGRHRAVPHQRRRELRAREVRPRDRRRRVPPPRGHRHRRRDGAPVELRSASGARATSDGDGDVPHPRRDRPGRVHDRRQRQPVHERHGPLQPAVRRAHRARDGG